ncbi:hypothetical protein PTKIN_Ptkin01aG0382600 [Pterospermum kingtungense]
MSNSTFLRKCTKSLLSAANFVVFSYLDVLDFVFCVVYKFLDAFFEGKASPCYCTSTSTSKKMSENGSNGKSWDFGNDEEIGMSETLLGRKKKSMKFIGLLEFVGKLLNKKQGVGDSSRKPKNGGVPRLGNRWSECGCDACISWMKNDDPKLHVVVKEASSSQAIIRDSKENPNPSENVIFIHGILSSSSFWTKTLFPKLSESEKSNEYNMFAVDILGYGQSPKPRDNLYTLKDHVEWIEKSVVTEYQLNSYHLVAHSMGCIIALALAAKHPKSIKSVTLVAPPYFPSKDGVEFTAINRFTPKRLWPPVEFISSIMAWDLNFMLLDLTKHTHHSGWHTTHNVLYRGVKQMDTNLETLMKSKKKVHVIVGTEDTSVPADCGHNIKKKFLDVEVNHIPNAGHRSIVFGREKDFAHDLFRIWENAAADHSNLHDV